MFRSVSAGLVAGLFLAASAQAQLPGNLAGGPFRRVATFPVFLNTDVADETVAEIVASAAGGNLLVYTDSANANLGFVDITVPASPAPAGVVALPGEPTSVAVVGDLALVCVNTSADFINVSGDLLVVNVLTRTIERTIPLGGQPDAIAISPDGNFAVIAIENERDEDLGNGEPPQAPAGFVVIVDLVGGVANWTTRNVSLVGLADRFPDDPEPEFVDINAFNIAVVTLQENNHIVLIELNSGLVLNDFSAGTVDLENIDIEEEDVIDPTGSLTGIPREPDAVAWISPFAFVTADEGDLDGGSRGYTSFSPFGTVLDAPGNALEETVIQLGHYPEGRSENKGNEPEGVEFGRYGLERFVFVGSERANLVQVFEVVGLPGFGPSKLVLRQALPTGVAPEGLLAIPERDLFVVACEADDRGDKLRSSVMIYERTEAFTYPTILSDRRANERPIGWGALSALATVPELPTFAFTAHDSFYDRSRIYLLDVSKQPARIRLDLELNDDQGVLATALAGLKAQLPGTDDFAVDGLVNGDGSVWLDIEGLAIAPGSFWVASEGTGNLVGGVSDPGSRPFERPNLLAQIGVDGTIRRVVFPPLELTQNQLRFGFEGVAVVGDQLFVAFQRAWQAAGDPSDRARIGRYDLTTDTWSFVHYPLESPTSPAGGWVGLSELVHLGGDEFAVIERDNQGGTDATIKRVQTFSIAGLTFRPSADVALFDVVTKALASDLLADGVYASTGGPIPEKQEGLAVAADGSVLLVNDNDGVDDNSGETWLLRLGPLFQ